MDPVEDISNAQFISYKCKDGKVYGFDIMSHNLIRKGSAPFTNPYNRQNYLEKLLITAIIFFKNIMTKKL